jgi:hypothetical protein
MSRDSSCGHFSLTTQPRCAMSVPNSPNIAHCLRHKHLPKSVLSCFYGDAYLKTHAVDCKISDAFVTRNSAIKSLYTKLVSVCTAAKPQVITSNHQQRAARTAPFIWLRIYTVGAPLSIFPTTFITLNNLNS